MLERFGMANPIAASWAAIGHKTPELLDNVYKFSADWLNAGEARWGEMYAQAVDETDMHYDTLRNYKWVASTIPLSLRNDKVPFSVCQLIAALPPDQRADAIQRAADEGWTVREARQQVRSIRALVWQGSPDTTLCVINSPAPQLIAVVNWDR